MDAAAAVDVDVTVERVLVDQMVCGAAGSGADRTWGRSMATARRCDQVTPPGGSRGGALCAGLEPRSPRQAGGTPGTMVTQGRANMTCGCGQQQASAKEMAGYQVLYALRSAAPATAACELGLTGSGEAWGRGVPLCHCLAGKASVGDG